MLTSRSSGEDALRDAGGRSNAPIAGVQLVGLVGFGVQHPDEVLLEEPNAVHGDARSDINDVAERSVGIGRERCFGPLGLAVGDSLGVMGGGAGLKARGGEEVTGGYERCSSVVGYNIL